VNAPTDESDVLSSEDGYSLKLEIVSSEKSLLREWYPLLIEIFPDKDDQESPEELMRRFRFPALNAFYILRDEKRGGKAIGIELRQLNPDSPGALYVPWAGLTDAYRNKGIYPLVAAICDDQMKAVGAKYCLLEVEDPARIHAAYPNESLEQLRSQTERRINFWRRNGAYVVRPLEQDAAYMRPVSSDDQKIQAYDLMAFRVFASDDTMWKSVFNAEKTAIGKESYRRFYLEMTRLQYGNLSESDLRQALPAVDRFLASLDTCPSHWMKLDIQPLRRETAAKPRIDLRFGSSGKRQAKPLYSTGQTLNRK
jgi:hypothetical protein